MANKMKQIQVGIRLLPVALILLLAFAAIALAEGGGRFEVDPWSFGVMGDTQWTVSEDPTGENQGECNICGEANEATPGGEVGSRHLHRLLSSGHGGTFQRCYQGHPHSSAYPGRSGTSR